MNWTETNKNLEKEFEFRNFTEAIRFVNGIHDIAEAENHHPDMLIHSYRKVKVMLYTHDENKITPKDYALAQKIDAIL